VEFSSAPERGLRLQWGEFTLDLESRQLRRSGEEIALGPKALALLELLATRRPRALSRAQIRDHLWPGTFVSESNLNSLVTQIRSALGDDPKAPAFIRTVHGFGYAFCGTASEGAPSHPAAPRPGVRFRLFWQDREVALGEGETILGRTDEAAVWVDAPTVSRRHARIVVSGGRAMLEDLGSRNGTWLRGKRIDSPRELSDGDPIRLGRVPLVFRVVRAAGSTQAESEV
jgi:DNA-binding winged helix-turn-helix (wHTH) protein